MSSVIRKCLGCVACLLLISALCACTKETPERSESITSVITEDKEFGNAVFYPSDEDLEKLNINFGDSVDISLGNGTVYKDIPFYNGVCDRIGTLVLAQYGSNKHLSLGYLNDGTFWKSSGCKEGDTITVSLAERGKYLMRQEVLSSSYSSNREDFPSDEAFSNLRSMKGGKLKKEMFFRGASPVNNSGNRAKCTDDLLRVNHIEYIVNLSDNKERLESYFAQEDFKSDYSLDLYKNGKVDLAEIGISFTDPSMCAKIAGILRGMMNNPGKTYFHCLIGKDRTGFACLVIEALAGATYREIEDDYMYTYKLLYGIDRENEPEKYEVIKEVVFQDLVLILTGSSDEASFNDNDVFQNQAKEYLKRGGMTDEEIEDAIEYLCE